MDANWKKKWVDALRSGEYQQGHYRLKNRDNGFCCLGVLCDVVSKEKPEIGQWNHNDNFAVEGDRYEVAARLPMEVSELTEINSTDPTVYEDGTRTTLSYLNDRGCTFNEIADIIERNL